MTFIYKTFIHTKLNILYYTVECYKVSFYSNIIRKLCYVFMLGLLRFGFITIISYCTDLYVPNVKLDIDIFDFVL